MRLVCYAAALPAGQERTLRQAHLFDYHVVSGHHSSILAPFSTQQDHVNTI
jgi:hypothetical protein